MHPFLIKTNTHWGRWREHAEVIFEKDEFTVVYNCGRSYLFKGIDDIAEKMQEVNFDDVPKWIESTKQRDIKTINSYENQIKELQNLINQKKQRWGIN